MPAMFSQSRDEASGRPAKRSKFKVKIWTQTAALTRKNWIILRRKKWWNLFRCFIIPLLYTSYVAQTIQFYKDSGNRGEGKIGDLPSLPRDLDGSKLVIYDGTGGPGRSFIDETLAAVGVDAEIEQISSPDQIVNACPGSLSSVSACFGAIYIDSLNEETGEMNYTFRGDYGRNTVDVDNWDKDDMLSRFIPLQWAIDSQWIRKTTGQTPAPPQAWLYTNINNDQYNEKTRVRFMIAMRGALVISWVVNFLFVAYQLAGSVASERAAGLTELLETMGCSTIARVLSWHLSVTLVNVPSFVVMAVMYRGITFKLTPYAYLIVMYLIIGISVASWTFLIAVPFAKKPTLAAIAAIGFCVIGAVFGMLVESNKVGQCIVTLLFPSSLIVFAHRIAASFEIPRKTFSWTSSSPNNDIPVIALVVLGIVNIFLWPIVAAYLERALFSLPSTHGPQKKNTHVDMPDNVAVRVDHLHKSFVSKRFFFFGKSKSVVAIEDLSFNIPRGEIFCLLGRNGAAKSTTLGCVAGLIRITSGSVRYAEDLRIGIAGQQDVLWDDLDCEQHVRLWRGIKALDNSNNSQIDQDLIEGCNLSPKLKSLSKTLSGGQKRKLQLACAIAGGSNLLLLDEISTGLDPLSRRAIWKIITSQRGDATIVLTTHFLDEADYLGDEIAILQAPGKLMAVDSPVDLKTRLGRGFHVAVDDTSGVKVNDILDLLRQDEPDVTVRPAKGRHLFGTGSTSVTTLRRMVRRLEQLRRHNPSLHYQVGSTTLEEVFIDLNSDDLEVTQSAMSKSLLKHHTNGSGDEDIEMQVPFKNRGFGGAQNIALCSPKPVPWWRRGMDMAWTVLRKRFMIFRRAWLIPVAAVVAVIMVSTIPIVFMDGRSDTCAVATETKGTQVMTFPQSPYATQGMRPLLAVNDANVGTAWTQALGQTQNVGSRDEFIAALKQTTRTQRFGGWSLQAMPAPQALVAYEGDFRDEDDDDSGLSQLKGMSALNAYTNSLFQQIRPGGAPFRINLKWDYIPYASFRATGKVLLWVTFFGAIMAIWPAFAAIYPSNEKTSGVRINQYSNGARPASLWAGHLLFELPGIFLVSTILVIVFAAVNQFEGLGYLWLCLVLYGVSSTIYGFIFSLRFKTSLGSWAVIACVNLVFFLYYIVMYQIIQLSSSATANDTVYIGHLGYAAVHPIISILRAAFVSVNIFSLRCDGRGNPTTKSFGDLQMFGAPIIYMIVQGILAFLLLVWFDSNRPMPHWLRRKRKVSQETSASKLSEDVIAEKDRVDKDSSDALVVKSLTKQFPGADKPSVDNVTFGVNQGQNFALIGPNGAGKTTALGCIRGVMLPSRGDVFVNGSSIVSDRNDARVSLGVCPQHSAIDAHLTVREHLWLYGRFKGVPKVELERDIAMLLEVSGLTAKTDDLAISLSGGNQRKLSLMMALIGDRPVILIDEFSSGVDPFSKREAWQVLAALTEERAVIMTTHSMEEVDALSSRVGIIAAKLLAVGTPSSLKSRYSTYEVHLLAEHVDQLTEYLQQHGINAKNSDDTLTRVTLPGIHEDQLDNLLGILQRAERDLGIQGMTLQEASTEAAFLAIVKENNVQEENSEPDKKKRGWWQWRKKRRDRKEAARGLQLHDE